MTFKKRGLIILIFITLFLAGCAGQAETTTTTERIVVVATTEPTAATQPVETAQPSPPTTIQIPVAATLPAGTTQIILQRKEFIPSEVNINPGSRLVFTVDDPEKFHKISCYNENSRIAMSGNLNDGDTFEVVFSEPVEYLCIDAIFGARMTINVGTSSPITGYAIIDREKFGKDSPVVFFALLIFVIIMYFVLKKRTASRNPAKMM